MTKLTRTFLLFILCLSLALTLAACGRSDTAGKAASSYEVVDAEGTKVEIPKQPHHILTLSMGTDEVMLGLVPPEDMAGVNELLDDPVSSNITELAAKIPKKVKNPGAEEIIAMQPDLVIVPDWGDLSVVPVLRDAGLPVVVCKGAKSLTEIEDTVQLLAKAAGVPDRGDKLVQMMKDKLAENSAKVEKIPESDRKSVVLISLMQTYGGKGSAFDEACQLAGVVNARAALGIADGTLMTKEDLVKADPDILFLPTYNDGGKYDVDAFRKTYLDDPSLQTIRAIKNHALKEPFEGYLYNNSQDFVFAVQEIDYQVYGDAFKLPDDEHLSAVPTK